MKKFISNMKHSFFVCSLILASNSLYAQTPSKNITATTKATATLAAVCTISAQNVNFGQIILPIANQNATSSMTIQCTKGSAYTIGLAYGGVYGQGTSGGGDYYIVTYIGGQGTYVVYNHYSATGTLLGSINNSALNTTGLVHGSSDLAVGAKWWVNPASTPYSYGLLNGVAHADTIGYSIQVPNQPAQVWNNGVNSYTSTATGSTQSIPIVATLQSGHGVSYPTADSYLDIIIATISY
jgi:spore coat protein U-like protein